MWFSNSSSSSSSCFGLQWHKVGEKANKTGRMSLSRVMGSFRTMQFHCAAKYFNGWNNKRTNNAQAEQNLLCFHLNLIFHCSSRLNNCNRVCLLRFAANCKYAIPLFLRPTCCDISLGLASIKMSTLRFSIVQKRKGSKALNRHLSRHAAAD